MARQKFAEPDSITLPHFIRLYVSINGYSVHPWMYLYRPKADNSEDESSEKGFLQRDESC